MLAIMRCTAEAVTSPSFSFAYLHRCTRYEARVVVDGLGFQVASFQLEPSFRVLAEPGGAVYAHAPFGFLLEGFGYFSVAFLVGLGGHPSAVHLGLPVHVCLYRAVLECLPLLVADGVDRSGFPLS